MTSSKARRKRRAADRPQKGPGAPAARSSEGGALPKPRRGVQLAIVAVACAYLATVWLDGVGSNLPSRVAPRPWLYFAQVAALFKNAGVMVIDYRAEVWRCEDGRWAEVDVRPWFRIDADTKESRFHRALQFYRRERKVMRELEAYVTARYEASPGAAPIGGVRFSSLRIPYPALGARVEPASRRPMAEYPEEMRKRWYYTPTSRRRERCRPARAAMGAIQSLPTSAEESGDEAAQGEREPTSEP